MKSLAILPQPGVGRRLRLVGWLVAALLAMAVTRPAFAQDQLVLESNNLVYDNQNGVISATGNVVVRYQGYVLNTDRLTYYQVTGRLVAVGNVRLVDASGNVIDAEQMDVTDDLSEGFIRQLYVATAEGVFFTAESAQRLEGRVTEFFNSTYTACQPRPNERPPLWTVRADQITHDEEQRMVEFQGARIEFFGVPVAVVPYLSTPDPTVTRATGFLTPEFSFSNVLGFGVGIPYFWAPAPNYDLTVTPTYHTNAGLLLDTEWRHRTVGGIYTIEAAGIYETSPGPAMLRGGVRTTGDFNLGRFWTFGWDGTLLSDRSFADTYSVLFPSNGLVTSEVQLVGLKDRAFVDFHAYHFRDVRAPEPRTDQGRQAAALPTIDHDIVLDNPVLGGEVRVTGNLTTIRRDADDPFNIPADPNTYFYGLAGHYTRLSEEVSWRREFVTPRGQVLTPFAFARGDAYFLDLTAPPPGITTDPVATRGMAGIGVEWSWPWLISMGQARHVIEPIVQILVRPSEALIGALPNDDAQSPYFDTTNLLAWDRFSGFDRAEGGTRLTLAMRYSGQLPNATIEAMIGQSFHLAGTNSAGVADIHNTGVGAGLGGTRSDLVASLVATGRRGTSLALNGRFDGMTYALQRGTVAVNADFGPVNATGGFAYDRTLRDLEGNPTMTAMVTGEASVAINPNWTIAAGLGYDFVSGTLTRDFIRLSYECDCAAMTLTFEETRTPGVPGVERTILFGLELRTLGEFDIARRNN